MKSDILIRSEGIKALNDKLGMIETEKFISLIHQDNFLEYRIF